MAATRDGRYLLWTVNEGGRTRPYLRDRCLAFRISSATTTGDIYTHNVDTGETCRLTYSMLGSIREADLVEPQLVHFPTFDREIPAWLYRPRNLPAGQRVPVVLSIHGGPEVQEKPTSSAIYQYLLDQGVAVLARNWGGARCSWSGRLSHTLTTCAPRS